MTSSAGRKVLSVRAALELISVETSTANLSLRSLAKGARVPTGLKGWDTAPTKG